MSCSNCYNGCAEITSDKCVRYTGIDVPILGIKNGDSLSYVEQSIVTYLVSALDGSGIKPNIDSSILCNLVKSNLPTCGEFTGVDFLTALIKSVCQLSSSTTTSLTSINNSITSINNFISSLEGSYNIGCLSGVTPTSGTHNIVQAIITKLCQFITSADTTYVKLSDINNIIAAFINSATSASAKTNMVPYTVVEYYGPLSGYPTAGDGFGPTGVGTGFWNRVFLCNGQNGTPDRRGRVAVGVTDGTMGGGALPAATAPGGLNPNYVVNGFAGANGIVLTEPQMPQHNHPVTVVSNISPNPHNHVARWTGGTTGPTAPGTGTLNDGNQVTSDVLLTITNNVTVGTKGNNEAHSNVQPSIGCYYIMYIP